MKEKKSVKKNYIYNVIYQILIIIIPIITTPYLARTIGASGNGIYGYTISIVTYFILFGSLGISLYGQREIAYVQDDTEKRSKIFWELILLRALTMSISAIVFYCLFCISGNYSIYFRILSIEILANLFDITWFYQGLECFKKITTRNLLIKTINIICVFTFVKTASDVAIYILIYSLGTLVSSISLWVNIKKFICIPKKINVFRHLKSVLVLFIPQIAIQIYVVLDKTMIGAILHDMSEVGYYEQSQKIIKILMTLVTSISVVMLPRIASCFAENNHKKIIEYIKKSFNFIFMLSIPIMFGIISVAYNFSPIFFGKGYDKVPIIMIILCPIIFIISISSVIGNQYLLSVKKQKQYTISVTVGAITNFILNFILINYFKSIGAAVATVVAELTVTLIQIHFVRKDFDLKEIFKLSINYFISGILMCLVCFGIDVLIKSKLIGLLTQIAIGPIIYFMCLIILKDKFISDLLHSGKSFISHKIKIKR